MPQSKDYKKTLMAQMDLNWDGVEELDEDEVPSEEEKKEGEEPE
jgi:hypothetical protein|tara:strand:+ start:360 stop:491 length:132 start_codon:yes stop_codon:yes gene_type:complete